MKAAHAFIACVFLIGTTMVVASEVSGKIWMSDKCEGAPAAIAEAKNGECLDQTVPVNGHNMPVSVKVTCAKLTADSTWELDVAMGHGCSNSLNVIKHQGTTCWSGDIVTGMAKGAFIVNCGASTPDPTPAPTKPAATPAPTKPAATPAPAPAATPATTPATTPAPSKPAVDVKPASNPNPLQNGAPNKLAAVTTPDPKYMGNVQIARVLQANEIVTGSFISSNVTVRANLDCSHVLTARMVEAKTVSAGTVVVGAIKSSSGTVIFSSNVQILSSDGLPQPQVQATSFLAENIIVGGVNQWKLVRHDDFNAEDAAEATRGWSLLETSSCSSNGDRFLGGHCNIANGEVSKVYRNLPPHRQVRVAARYHMIDNWQGETAFLKLGEHVAWAHRSRAHDSQKHGLEMCGNAAYPEQSMSLPIDVTQAHSESFLQVSVGSRGGSAEQDPCERSFGLDDVMVYVR